MRKALLFTFLFIYLNIAASQTISYEKELFIPENIWLIPKNNDYSNNDSDYCFNRMVESDNIALLWHKEYGNDPENNEIKEKRFNPKKAIIECERFYNFYVDSLKLVQKGNSLSDKYKLLIFVFRGDEGTAFGGGSGDIGVLWTPAVRINKSPYGALAHEIGHSFQYLSRKDSKTGPNGPVMEMSAQYMLWQVYPDWLTFENYHLQDFLKGTHYSFLHPKNMYHSPFVLEYWSEKHGKQFWGELSRNTKENEDVVKTYQRINNLSQDQFNDEMFDANRRFITWDLPRIDSIAKPYRNIHKSKLTNSGNGWFKIDSINTPQNYGYNAIKLNTATSGKIIKLHFKGLTEDPGYNIINKDKAGWRYGFVAFKKNGQRIYSKTYKDSDNKIEFKIPDKTDYLWFVVMGAPSQHWSIPFSPSNKEEKNQEEQWPYAIKIKGSTIDDFFIKQTN